MSNFQKTTLVILRLVLGWLFFYAGLSQILNPQWSIAAYLHNAKTFSGFYLWLAQPEYLSYVTLINEWALILVGVSLILGLFSRFGAACGTVLMILYYFPGLTFPYAGDPVSLIVDKHLVFAAILLFLTATKSGNIGGIDYLISKYSKS